MTTAILTLITTVALSTNEPKKVLILVKIIIPPTHTANIYTGITFTIHAANGAAMAPPTAKAITKPRLICSQPRNIIKPSEADKVIKNSLADTVPITYRGSTLFHDNNKGVLTGPQPPPPIVSKNPATIP